MLRRLATLNLPRTTNSKTARLAPTYFNPSKSESTRFNPSYRPFNMSAPTPTAAPTPAAPAAPVAGAAPVDKRAPKVKKAKKDDLSGAMASLELDPQPEFLAHRIEMFDRLQALEVARVAGQSSRASLSS
jgi:hypothetical protein